VISLAELIKDKFLIHAGRSLTFGIHANLAKHVQLLLRARIGWPTPE